MSTVSVAPVVWFPIFSEVMERGLVLEPIDVEADDMKSACAAARATFRRQIDPKTGIMRVTDMLGQAWEIGPDAQRSMSVVFTSNYK